MCHAAADRSSETKVGLSRREPATNNSSISVNWLIVNNSKETQRKNNGCESQAAQDHWHKRRGWVTVDEMPPRNHIVHFQLSKLNFAQGIQTIHSHSAAIGQTRGQCKMRVTVRVNCKCRVQIRVPDINFSDIVNYDVCTPHFSKNPIGNKISPISRPPNTRTHVCRYILVEIKPTRARIRQFARSKCPPP